MENEMELQQIIYKTLAVQIEFGVYRFEEQLPTIEEASQLFLVSTDTVRSAYLRLKHDGYITLSRSVGALVKVSYDTEDTDRHIQNFYAIRKDALIELSRSMRPLLSYAQWVGFKKASPETLDQMEALALRTDILPPYRMIRHLQLIYGSLQNELLTRMVWQIFMFFQAPLFSIRFTARRYEGDNSLLYMIRLCRQKDWAALRSSIETFQEQLSRALCSFYDSKITVQSPEQQIPFQWTSYKKATQRCYSLGMELLKAINREIYPAGTFLPSLERLAKERQVSVSTIRRTLTLLNSIGVTKSFNGLGTQILSQEEIAENCDFTNPVLQRRLLDYAQSMQIIALSCREVSRITAAAFTPADRALVMERLKLLQRLGRQELASYGILELFTHMAPYQAIRNIYTELYQQLLWGYPLRSIITDQARRTACIAYLDTFMECLEQSDVEGLSAHLEEFIYSELRFASAELEKLGIGNVTPLALRDFNLSF